MILTCPDCATRFNAKDEAFLPAGRRVRCAKCGHTWFQGPPPAVADDDDLAIDDDVPAPRAPEPDADPAPEEILRAGSAPEPEPDVPPQPEPEKRGLSRGGLLVAAGWAALVLVVLLIGWAAASYRDQVAELWPQSASLYKALGLPVNTSGLDFADIAYDREIEDNQAVLAVTGTLVNLGHSIQAVPKVRVILSAADGHELYHWEFAPKVTMLKPGQRVPFKTRLSSPPAEARHLTVEFASAKG